MPALVSENNGDTPKNKKETNREETKGWIFEILEIEERAGVPRR